MCGFFWCAFLFTLPLFVSFFFSSELKKAVSIKKLQIPYFGRVKKRLLEQRKNKNRIRVIAFFLFRF